MAWFFEDEASADADAVLQRVRDTGAIVPALWYWEVANVLIMASKRGRISSSDIAVRLHLLSALPIRIDENSPGRVWHDTISFAQTHALTAYDASYLELAVRKSAELATLDKAMRKAASNAGIKLLPL